MFRTIIKILTIMIFASTISCGVKDDTLQMEVLINDSLKINEKVLVKIFSNRKNWSIEKAYFDCNDESNKIHNDNIIGCDKELFVSQDTILIQFIPRNVGSENFGKIKVLLKKEGETPRVLETDFSYSVFSN